jgi:hypothetical protein
VVPPALVAAGSFDDIRARAAAFVAACNAPPAA